MTLNDLAAMLYPNELVTSYQVDRAGNVIGAQTRLLWSPIYKHGRDTGRRKPIVDGTAERCLLRELRMAPSPGRATTPLTRTGG